MKTTTMYNETAAKKIQSKTTSEVIATFILSGKMIEAGHPDSNLYTVRGWLMDELERRDPEAFDRWLSVDGFPTDESLYNYYPC